jgi:hypothetical protein
VLIFFWVAIAFVSLFGWAVFLWFWCALPMSAFYRDACPSISLHFAGVDQHWTFELSDRFGCLVWTEVFLFV